MTIDFIDKLKEYKTNGTRLRIVTISNSGQGFYRGIITDLQGSLMTIQLSPYTARKYNVGTLNLNLNAIDIEQIEVLPDNWEGWENGEPTQWTGVRRWVYEFKAKFFDNP